jgi:hypothetical protein
MTVRSLVVAISRTVVGLPSAWSRHGSVIGRAGHFARYAAR